MGLEVKFPSTFLINTQWTFAISISSSMLPHHAIKQANGEFLPCIKQGHGPCMAIEIYISPTHKCSGLFLDFGSDPLLSCYHFWLLVSLKPIYPMAYYCPILIWPPEIIYPIPYQITCIHSFLRIVLLPCPTS